MKAMAIPTNSRCSIARSLEVLGQKWSLLIVREAFRGRTRFAEFQKIGVPTDLLASRLESLVEAGILARRPYREPGQRARVEYVLTPAGEDLLPVLAALSGWGDEYRPTGHGPATIYVDTTDDRPVHLAFVDEDGHAVDPAKVAYRRGPGALED
ncbi:helix-turn-helix domain-containing protein [Amycolatopsis sp. NPDC023774]|uniref:winged helix-turn-helix transcriptional regulator n=1 Tax=Amycolatopsis sp. NPDC023774 TaxID=3155015 RepID=UPI0033FE24A8